MRSRLLILLMGAVASTAVLAQQAPQGQQPTAQCDVLVTTVERNQNNPALTLTLEEARTFQRTGDQTVCATELASLNAAISVQQPGAAGQAGGGNAAQAQANVVVNQPMPEIIVRQPAPQITVDMPQAEIIVRMPPLNLDVQAIEQAVQQGQPNVRYEMAEPQVVVNQPQEGPIIRFEQGEGAVGQQAAIGGQQQPGQLQPGAGQAGAPAQGGMAQEQTVAMAPSEIVGMTVVDQQGDEIGQIENVVVYAGTNEHFLVIDQNANLGADDKRIALALADVFVIGDQLLIPATRQELAAFPAWQESQQYTPAQDGQNLEIQAGQQQ